MFSVPTSLDWIESEDNHRFFDFPILPFARVGLLTGFAILLAAGIFFVGTDRFGSFESSVVKNEEYAAGGELNPGVEESRLTCLSTSGTIADKQCGGLDRPPHFSSVDVRFATFLGLSIIHTNIRGSRGFGNEFMDADNGAKREDAVRDISSLLDWIEKQPDLDADTVIIRGESYTGAMVALATG